MKRKVISLILALLLLLNVAFPNTGLFADTEGEQQITEEADDEGGAYLDTRQSEEDEDEDEDDNLEAAAVAPEDAEAASEPEDFDGDVVLAEASAEESEEGTETADEEMEEIPADVLAAAEAEEEENSAEGSTGTPEQAEEEEAEEAEEAEDNLAVEPENSELESETATDGAIQPQIIKPMAHRGSGKDITARVNTTKPDVYVLKDGKKIYVLKNGKVQLYDENGNPSANGKPRLIKSWEDVVFEYKWNIPHQEHNPLQTGDWFTIDLPNLKDLKIKALNFDKNKDYNIDWYNGETKKSEVLGSFRVDTDAQKLTAKLNKNGASKYAITDGFFRLKFRAEETLEVTPGEKGTTGINVEKPNNPGGNNPIGKGKLNPGEGFHKGGYTTNRNGQRVIRWDIGVNADQLKKYLETGKTDDEKKNVWVEDDLPDAGMEVIDPIFLLPLYLFTDKGEVSSSGRVWKEMAPKAIYRPNAGETYDNFKKRIQKKGFATPFSAAIYPAKGNQSAKVLFYFGSLGKNSSISCSDFGDGRFEFEALEELNKLKNQNRITKKQYEFTKAAYGIDGKSHTKMKKMVACMASFFTKQDKPGEYKNEAKMTWDNGGKKADVILNYASAEGGADYYGTTSFKVRKKWQGTSIKPVTIRLLRKEDGEEKEVDSIELKEGYLYHEFKNLPEYKYDGTTNKKTKLEYRVVEDKNEAYEIEKAEWEGDVYVITNKLTQIEIEVHKQWENDNDDPKVRPDSITVELLADDQPTGKKVELNEGNGWRNWFRNLPEYKDGKKIKYSVREVNAPDGYISKHEHWHDKLKGNDRFEIINTFTPTEVEVEKKWVGTVAGSVQVQLLKDNVPYGDIVTLNAANRWHHKFENLPKFRWDGNQTVDIRYSVKEVNVPDGYTDSKQELTPGKWIITNTEDTTEVSVEKSWVGGQGKDSVTVKLFADGVFTGQTKVLSAGNGWQAVFDNLPKSKDGRIIEYSIKEVPVPGYTSDVQAQGNNHWKITNTRINTSVKVEKRWEGVKKESVEVELWADGTKVDSVTLKEANQWRHTFTNLPKYKEVSGQPVEIQYTVKENVPAGYKDATTGNATDGYIITNTQRTTEFTVDKRWFPHQSETIEEIKVNIKEKEDGFIRQITLKKSEGWTKTLTDLPEYNSKGHKAEYHAEEVAVPGYKPESKTSICQTTLFNIKLIDIPVRKVWLAANKQEIEVVLLANGKAIQNEFLNEGNNWEHTFKNLPTYEKGQDGQYHPVTYKVKEVTLAGYQSKITQKDKNDITKGVIITNTELIEIPVKKVWQSSKPKQTVEVELHYADANGQPNGRVSGVPALRLTAPNFTGKFPPVPLRDENNQPIRYTVKEVTALNGYVAPMVSVDPNHANGFVITNIEETEREVVKLWKDNPATRPAKIFVTLYADGNPVAGHTNIELTEAKGWKHKFEHLPKYTADGTLIRYTVKETAVAGYTEMARNEDSFTITNISQEKTKIEVEKKWAIPQGSEDPDIEVTVELYKDNLANPIATRKLSKTTQWKATFDNLDVFDPQDGHRIQYTVKEKDIAGYTPTETGQNTGKVTITNTIVGKVSVGVTKKWLGKAASSVTIQLLANNQVKETVKLPKENKWTYTFTNLDKYDKNGQEITYTVKEVAIDGYKSKVEGDVEKGFTITNYNTEKITIPVKKNWVGPKKEVTVILYADGTERGRLSLHSGNNWSGEFENLPKYSQKDGREIVYTIKELKIEGYQTDIVKNNNTDVTKGFTITNTNTETVEVPVKKNWIGKGLDKVTVRVFGDGKEKGSVVLSKDNHWQHTFTGLPKYTPAGVKIVYTVKEDPIAGYKPRIDGDAKKGFTITNTNTATLEIPVKKVWVGPALKEITVKLLADGVERDRLTLNKDNNWEGKFTNLAKYSAVTGEEIRYTIEEIKVPNYNSVITGDTTGYTITNTNTETVDIPVAKEWIGKKADSVTIRLLADNVEKAHVILNAANHWRHTFTGLPKYKADGSEIVYTVKEDPIAGYKPRIDGDAKKGFTITNTNTATLEIPVKKVWVGPALKEITVKLLADGVERDKLTLNKDNNWQGRFTNLAKYSAVTGEEIRYTIEEVKVPNYNSVITGDTTGYTITNTNTETIDIPVAKEWIGKKADSATVYLFADNVQKDSVVLSAANHWRHTFKGLPKYKADGSEIVYTLKEAAIAGYVTRIDGNAKQGFTVVNRNTATLEIPVKKVWVGPATQEITVKLLADGVERDRLTLNVGNNWQGKFTGLAKYSAVTGEEIRYTIEEVKVPNYSSKITGSMADGYTITNTNTEMLDIPVVKKWVGDVADEITIELLKDGNVEQTITLKKADFGTGVWSYTFKGLPRYDAATGRAFVYTVRENYMPWYSTQITGDMTTGYTIINTQQTPPPPYVPDEPGGTPPAPDTPRDPGNPPTKPTPPNPPTSIDDDPIPHGDSPTPEVPFDDDIPQGVPELPKTDGIPAVGFSLLGLALAGLGLRFKRK